MNPVYRVRKAEAHDGPALLTLVRALADYEHLPGPDEDAARRLLSHGFGESCYFEAVLAETERETVGFALYFMTYSTFLARPSLYLEDLFVAPEHRRQGVGTRLLRHLAAIALDHECGRFEWTVLDWNESARRFYESLGARVLQDWRICRIDDSATLARLAARATT